jgi:hypothetical protein
VIYEVGRVVAFFAGTIGGSAGFDIYRGDGENTDTKHFAMFIHNH